MNLQRGMTLVELVLAIVIVGIAAAALFGAMASITGRSADPMLRQQSLAIAESYLEEILLKDFPSDVGTCTDIANSANRSSFSNVCAYDGLNDTGARDANGNAITTRGVDGNPVAMLDAYKVSVNVTAKPWAGLMQANALYVEVRVIDPAGHELVLAGYRAR
jgi:MSHA pilin protein MshD